MVKDFECDKLSNNIIVVNSIIPKRFGMSNTSSYQTKEMKKNGMKMIFEFPTTTANDNQIKQEVKEILKGALEEHLKKIS